MEIYKWKWMVLGALGCINNANFEKKNCKWQHCVRCVYYLSEITTRTIWKTPYSYIPMDFQSNPPMRLHSATNDVEGVEYRRLHYVWISTSHGSHIFCPTLDLQLSLYRPLCYNSRAHCLVLQYLRTTSAILAGAHSYCVVSSFKCEGEILVVT